MTDIALNPPGGSGAGIADLLIDGVDLATDDGLQTAVYISLFSDRLAMPDDLPAGEADRRGWWGDMFPDAPDDQFGSHLWLLQREKQTQETRLRAEGYARRALDWMLEDRIADRVDVAASYPERGVLLIEVAIRRPTGNRLEFRYHYNWTEQAAEQA